ncbi:MAG: hypothetical protein M0T71_10470, partial [Actinomycetota bacterium]|nr:hypothetical protein [Actinomycetota bacterium]
MSAPVRQVNPTDAPVSRARPGRRGGAAAPVDAFAAALAALTPGTERTPAASAAADRLGRGPAGEPPAGPPA